MIQRAPNSIFPTEALLHSLRRGFAVFCSLWAGCLFAQPQAPITWAGAHWVETDIIGDRDPIAMTGDTVVFFGAIPPQYPFATAYSFDNGTTCSADHFLNYPPSGPPTLQITGGDGVTCLFGVDQGYNGMWFTRSTNYGVSWSPWQEFPIADGWNMPCVWQCGHYVIRFVESNQNMGLVMSIDHGSTWNPREVVDTNYAAVLQHGIVLTRDHIVVLGEDDTQTFMLCARRTRTSTQWEPFRTLPNQPYGGPGMQAPRATLTGDTASEVIGIATACGDFFGAADLWVVRSTDAGGTWQPPLRLTLDSNGGTVPYGFFPMLFSKGKLWAVAWYNSVHDVPAETGVYCRFSANHGRCWYATQRISDHDAIHYTSGQFHDNRASVYWTADTATTIQYRMATGLITPDTVLPVIVAGDILPDEVSPGTLEAFHISATDEDSIPFAEAVLKREGSADSVVVDLADRIFPTDFRGTWTVPEDTALWHYYYRAEDMWENFSVYPDTGVFSFHTTGWSKASSLSPYPLALSLSSFPNPFNSPARISFSIPRAGDVRLDVYDITGRLAATLVQERISAGEHEFNFDGSKLASGIYFARLRAGADVRIRKMVLLK